MRFIIESRDQSKRESAVQDAKRTVSTKRNRADWTSRVTNWKCGWGTYYWDFGRLRAKRRVREGNFRSGKRNRREIRGVKRQRASTSRGFVRATRRQHVRREIPRLVRVSRRQSTRVHEEAKLGANLSSRRRKFFFFREPRYLRVIGYL